MKEFLECCSKWAKAISPRGKVWFWLLFLPVTGPFIYLAGEEAYMIVLRLSVIGMAALISIWVSYLLRSYFNEDLELEVLLDMMDSASESDVLQDRTSVILSRALMIAASWLSRAIVMIGFLWAVVIAFGGSYIS